MPLHVIRYKMRFTGTNMYFGICLISRFTHVPWSSSVCCHLLFPYLTLFAALPNPFSSGFSNLYLPLVPDFFLLFFHFPLVCSSFIFPSSCHFAFPSPFSLHTSLFPQSSPSACYRRPEPNRKSGTNMIITCFDK